MSEGGVAGMAKSQVISARIFPKSSPEYMACHTFPRKTADHRTPAHNTKDVVGMAWFTRVAGPGAALIYRDNPYPCPIPCLPLL